MLLTKESLGELLLPPFSLLCALHPSLAQLGSGLSGLIHRLPRFTSERDSTTFTPFTHTK